MDEPWYQSSGPCSHQVRDDVFNKFFKSKDIHRNTKILDILIDVVPEHRNDFGSYRGYACFGNQIHDEIKNQFALEFAKKNHFTKIRNDFIHGWIMNRLYRFPDGFRVKELKKEFYDLA
jgi:hypothetical protein